MPILALKFLEREGGVTGDANLAIAGVALWILLAGQKTYSDVVRYPTKETRQSAYLHELKPDEGYEATATEEEKENVPSFRRGQTDTRAAPTFGKRRWDFWRGELATLLEADGLQDDVKDMGLLSLELMDLIPRGCI